MIELIMEGNTTMRDSMNKHKLRQTLHTAEREGNLFVDNNDTNPINELQLTEKGRALVQEALNLCLERSKRQGCELNKRNKFTQDNGPAALSRIGLKNLISALQIL